VPDGLEIELVYDTRDPTRALPADAVDPSLWRTNAMWCLLSVVGCVALAIGRWRWIGELQRIARGTAPSRAMRLAGWHVGKIRKDRDGQLIAPSSRATLTPLDRDVPALKVSFSSSPFVDRVRDGDVVQVAGDAEPGTAVALDLGDGVWLWPARKARRG
jgi:hypothetical protein